MLCSLANFTIVCEKDHEFIIFLDNQLAVVRVATHLDFLGCSWYASQRGLVLDIESLILELGLVVNLTSG